jgi:hypothetical protein
MGSRLTIFLATSMLLVFTATTSASQRLSGHSEQRRSWQVNLRVAVPYRYALAELNFSSRGGRPRITLNGPIAADYIAAAQLHATSTGEIRILVLIINRATGLMDPARIGLNVHLSRPLHRPLVLEATGFPAAGQITRPALCQPLLDRAPLKESHLRALLAAGAALPGYSTVSAVSEGYDATCSLPFQAAFEQAVAETQAPSPSPPAPSPPIGCAPCTPPPGYACPLVAKPSVCIAPETVTRRASQLAH